MNLLDALLNSQSGPASQIARSVGVNESQAKDIISQLMPAIARGMQNNANSQGGLESLLGALSNGNHQRYVESPDMLSEPSTINDGNAILGHIFGSKDTSREVASRAASRTGVDSDIIKKMLPMVAAAAMGMMSKQSAGLPSSASALKSSNASPLMSMLSGMLDADNDGSIADDLIGLASKFLR